MFRKFQEFTLKFFYDEDVAAGVSNDDLGVIAIIYILLLLGEVISTIACIINTCSDGFTDITIPWLAASAVYWGTMIISCCAENKYNIPKKPDMTSFRLNRNDSYSRCLFCCLFI